MADTNGGCDGCKLEMKGMLIVLKSDPAEACAPTHTRVGNARGSPGGGGGVASGARCHTQLKITPEWPCVWVCRFNEQNLVTGLVTLREEPHYVTPL